MTNKTPARILEKYKRGITGQGGIYITEQEALAALDDYYRQYYVGLLPEKLNIRRPKGLNRDAIWTAPQINVVEGYNKALDDIRHRMEGNDD